MTIYNRLRQKELEQAPREIITGSFVMKAVDNIPKYFARPDTPLKMMRRTIEMCQVVSEMLGGDTGIYANGFPFSGGYNLLVNSSEPPPIVQEIQRYTKQKSNDVNELLTDKAHVPYHCLSDGIMPEHTMVGVDGKGTDYTEQIYRCPHCNPRVQQIFAPFPDIDIYAIVKDYPSPEKLLDITRLGENMGLYPKYKNLSGIINSFANFDETNPPPLSIDYFFVTESDVLEKLNNFNEKDWVNLKVPCQMVRFGTQTFRKDFLELGKNLGLDIQTIISKGKMHQLIEQATKKLLETDSSRLLNDFQKNSTSSSKLLYTDPVIAETVKLRHDMIRSEGMSSLL